MNESFCLTNVSIITMPLVLVDLYIPWKFNSVIFNLIATYLFILLTVQCLLSEEETFRCSEQHSTDHDEHHQSTAAGMQEYYFTLSILL